IELNEERSARVARPDVVGDSETQARLPGPPGPGECQKPGGLQVPPYVRDFALPPHETRHLDGQVARRLQAARRRKLRRQARDDELDEGFGAVEVLQTMGAEIAECHARRERALD